MADLADGGAARPGGALLARRLRPLPASLSSFVGRRPELAEAKRLLSQARLLTVIGFGGVGKTRLALELGRDLQRAFPDGVCLVELATVRGSERVAAAVAEALGLEESGDSPLAAITTALSSRRMLLLVDNCEQVLDGAARVVGELLATCPDLVVAATSRRPLGISGETVLSLSPLELPPDDRAGEPGSLVRYDAVQLFAERAAAAMPGFELAADNAAVVVQLCRRLDGLPLALELAAGRMRALDPEQLLQQLSRKLGVLQGAGTSAARQQTLVATLDWSHDLLDDAQRALWRRLAVFSGGATADAVESVCAGGAVHADDLVDVLADLVDRSLVVRDGRGVDTRYRLLEVVHDYARTRLTEAGEVADVVLRHRRWVAGLAARSYAAWWGPDQHAVLAELQAEYANVVAALDRCLLDDDPAAGAAAGLAIAADLWHLWTKRGHLADGAGRLGLMLDRAVEPTETRARALATAGFLSLQQGDSARASRWLAESVTLGRRFGDPALTAAPLVYLAQAELGGDHPDQAAALAEEAVELARAAGDPMLTTVALNMRASLAAMTDPPLGARLFAEGISLCETSGDRWLRQRLLQGLGMCLIGQRRPAEAVERFRESLATAHEFDDWRGVGFALEGTAQARLDAGQPEDAVELLGAASAVWQSCVGGDVPPPGVWLGWHERTERVAREQLGARRYEQARQRGSEVPMTETVTRMLGRTESPEALPVAASRRSPLTRRETEVAALVARGLRNREIAGQLFLSERTVESHVDHILTKLGLSSRVKVAAWASELGLDA